jgi:hypothetical protein
MLDQIVKGLKLIKIEGLIPFKYKPMGVSPRILPERYSMSIYSVIRIIRDDAYQSVSEEARAQEHYIEINDFDIKSCYTSIPLYF